MKLSDVLALYIARKRLSDKTVAVYGTTLHQLRVCLAREPTTDDLSDDLLLRFERWLTSGRSAYTVRERSARVKALWRFAAKRGLVQDWPTLSPPPVPEIAPRAWDTSQIERLVMATDQMTGAVAGIPSAKWWRAWVLVAWVTGERTGALRQLRWDHADLTRGVLDLPGSIRKTGKAAMYDLPAFAVAAIESIRSDSPHVFPWDRCDAIFHKRFNRLLKLAGLPPGGKNQTQRIRRSHLTYWQAGGGDATARAQHSSSGLTWKHYLDKTLLPRDKPADRLPPLKLFDVG